MELIDDSLGSSISVYFCQVSGEWWAGFDDERQKLNLGDSKRFGFYFSDGTTNSPFKVYDVTALGGDDYRLVNSNTLMDVLAHDLKPVPISSAFWLFGFGFIGLVGLKRKFWK